MFEIGSGWFPERKGGAESVMHNICTHLGGHGFAVSGVVAGNSRVEADTSNQYAASPQLGIPRLAVSGGCAGRREPASPNACQIWWPRTSPFTRLRCWT